jgi:16S rRNA (adenine1518-N6/adenine1519-N6)-dimethyltransferase
MQYTLKKSMGQQFLHDENVCLKIVDAIGEPEGLLLEIGPGGGAITKYLKDLPFEQYRCIELDFEKVAYLKTTYPDLADKIIQGDFLHALPPFESSFKIAGNFPYNISTQIVFKVLDWRNQVTELTGMFQKEVAQRIASAHGNKNYGILSVLTQCYYEVEYLFDVDANSFTPPPKVVSGVIKMKRKNEPDQIEDYLGFKKFVKAAFNQRRKTLRNGFKSILSPEILKEEIFNKRAEQLSVQEFIELYKMTRKQCV